MRNVDTKGSFHINQNENISNKFKCISLKISTQGIYEFNGITSVIFKKQLGNF